jgi:hypothetical protein
VSTLLVLLVLQQGTWGEPAREAFLDPASRSLLAGLNAVSLDGLTPASTRFDFDGVTLLAPAHGLFGPTTLHPAWTERVDVGAGIASVEHGRTLGRTVSLFSRTPPAADRTHAWLRLDLFHTGVFFERSTKDGDAFQGAVRFFTTAAIAGAVLRGSILLGDYQLRWDQRLGAGRLRVLAVGALDSLALTVSGIPLAARLQNHQLDVRWRSDALELGVGAHRSTIGLTLNGATVANAIDGAEDALNARANVFGRLAGTTRGIAGVDVELRRLSLLRGTSFVGAPGGDTTTLRELGVAMVAGVFGEATLMDGDWQTTLGVRADVWVPARGAAILTGDPRLTTRRRIGPVEFILALGLTHQAPSWLVTVPVLESLALRQGVQELVRADATGVLHLSTFDSFTAHLFAGGLSRAIEYSPFDESFLQLVNQVEDDVAKRSTVGWIAGGDAVLRFSSSPGAVRTWGEFSYSFQQSQRLATFSRFDVTGTPTGEAEAWVPWQFRQSHLLRARAGVEWESGWKLSASATLSTGPPMVGGLFPQEQRPGRDALTQAPRWVPLDRDFSRDALPWLRADVRVSKTWHPTPLLELEAFLDVANLSTPQPTGLSYGTAPATLEQQARGELTLTSKLASSPLPPIPVLGLDVRL